MTLFRSCCHQIPEEPFTRNNCGNMSEWCCLGFSTIGYTVLSVKLSKTFRQTLHFSLVQPVSPVHIPCLAYFCGSEPQTEWCDAYLYMSFFFFFFCSVHLYYLFPSLEEGGLATYRTAIVQNQHLAMLAKVCPTSEPGVEPGA